MRYRFDLKKVEAEALLRACRKYRSSLPIYLQSTQHEVAVIDLLIQRLQERLDK